MLRKAAYLENLACTGDWKGKKSCKGGGLTWLPGHPGHTVATPLCPQPRLRRGRPCRPGFGQGAGDSGKSSHPSPARLPEAWRGPRPAEVSQSPWALGDTHSPAAAWPAAETGSPGPCSTGRRDAWPPGWPAPSGLWGRRGASARVPQAPATPPAGGGRTGMRLWDPGGAGLNTDSVAARGRSSWGRPVVSATHSTAPRC